MIEDLRLAALLDKDVQTSSGDIHERNDGYDPAIEHGISPFSEAYQSWKKSRSQRYGSSADQHERKRVEKLGGVLAAALSLALQIGSSPEMARTKARAISSPVPGPLDMKLLPPDAVNRAIGLILSKATQERYQIDINEVSPHFADACSGSPLDSAWRKQIRAIARIAFLAASDKDRALLNSFAQLAILEHMVRQAANTA